METLKRFDSECGEQNLQDCIHLVRRLTGLEIQMAYGESNLILLVNHNKKAVYNVKKETEDVVEVQNGYDSKNVDLGSGLRFF